LPTEGQQHGEKGFQSCSEQEQESRRLGRAEGGQTHRPRRPHQQGDATCQGNAKRNSASRRRRHSGVHVALSCWGISHASRREDLDRIPVERPASHISLFYVRLARTAGCINENQRQPTGRVLKRKKPGSTESRVSQVASATRAPNLANVSTAGRWIGHSATS